MNVTYASAPATLSVRPPPWAVATTGAETPACPQLGQVEAPAGISLPQPVQNAIASSGPPDIVNSHPRRAANLDSSQARAGSYQKLGIKAMMKSKLNATYIS